MGVFNTMSIKSYRYQQNEIYIYRCSRCNARKGLLSIGAFKTGKLNLNIYLSAIYLFVLDIKVVQVYNILGISMNAYTRLRDKCAQTTIGIMNELIPRIGGPDKIVEIDEMAFGRAQLVSNPTNET